MKPVTKKILILSSCFMGAGVILTAAGIFAGGRPGFMFTEEGFVSASSAASETRENYRLEKTAIDPFTGIDLRLDSQADIEFLPSEDGQFYLEYSLSGYAGRPEWDVSGDTFTLSQEEQVVQGFYLFGPDFSIPSAPSSPYIRLYIPENCVFSEVGLTSGYGDLSMAGFHAETLSIYLDFGSLTLENISADTISCSLDYGDMEMNGCSFTDADVQLSAGDLDAADSSADTLNLVNEYGDSSFENSSIRAADVTVEFGDLTLDVSGLETLTGENEYGDTLFILHEPLDMFSFLLNTEFGAIRLPDDASGRLTSNEYSDEMSYETDSGSRKQIEFTAADGDIEIQYERQ